MQGRGCLMSSIQKTFLISSISALAVCGISWALYSKYKKANKGMKPESCATDYDLATEARSQGNKFFREGKYSEAIDCYNRAISLYPTGNVDLALAYANRAAAFMAMNNFSSAQHDCDVAIEIDPYFSKAIDRRSRINYHTGQFEEALYDALAAAVVDKLKNLKFSEHLEKCLFKVSELYTKELYKVRLAVGYTLYM